MKVLGITTEYNPFHNGHLYIARKAREEYCADCVIAVMSGNFTQRGEATISDKWTRAKAAITSSEGAIDVVFELPFAFACNRAEYFAKGAVDMLVMLGANAITFGCEAENPDNLNELALKLLNEKETLVSKTATFMKKGVSYAKAYEFAVDEVLGEEATSLMNTPNNILAIEYLKCINLWRKNGVNILDIPIKRVGSGYNDVGDKYAGASKIREMIMQGKNIGSYVPMPSNYEDYNSLERRYFEMLKAIILRSSAKELSLIYGIGEGLENKLLKEVTSADSFDNYLNALISKRYTAASIKRMLTYVLLGVNGKVMDNLISKKPAFGRLLASNNKGREYIRKYKSDIFSIVTNVNKICPASSGEEYNHITMDIHAADMYNLLCDRDLYSFSDRVMRPFIS